MDRGCGCRSFERLSPSRSRVLHRAEQVDLLRRSSFFVGSDRLLSQKLARIALCLQVGQRCLQTLSEGRALKVVWWLDEFCEVETLHARFYGFEKVVGSESATGFEPDCTVLRLSSD